MWWLNWRPLPPCPPFSSSVCSHLYSFSGELHSSFRSLQSTCLPPYLPIFMPVFNEVVSLYGHTIITPVLFCPSSTIPMHYFDVFISASSYSSLSPPSLSTVIFCCAWRTHLTCGCLGSDGYISGGSGESLPSLGFLLADADFPLKGESIVSGCSAALPTARAGRHPHRHAAFMFVLCGG